MAQRLCGPKLHATLAWREVLNVFPWSYLNRDIVPWLEYDAGIR